MYNVKFFFSIKIKKIILFTLANILLPKYIK